MASDLERAATNFRAALLREDARAARQMVDAYSLAYGVIQERLNGLLEQMREAASVSLSWLFQRQRLSSLQQTAAEQMGQFAQQAEGVITSQQRSFVEQAQSDAADLARLAAGSAPDAAVLPWTRLPTGALTELVGVLGNGSPVAALLDELPSEASQGVRKVLVQGVATGQNPRAMARRMRQELGGNLNRALTISRTETLRAYRESSRLAYRENADVVEQWQWVAQLSGRTCASCLAMHGTKHPLTEPMGSHPNCRCVQVPVTKSWAELGLEGLEDTQPEIESAEAWFASQPPEVQANVLGDAGAAAYRRGEVTLADFVRETHSRAWGTTRTTNGLKDAEAAAEERKRRELEALKPEVPTLSQKALLAKQTSRRIGADVQRYSEEHCEPILANGLKTAGIETASLRDNEPVDVVMEIGGKITDGIELKTMTENKNNKITMKASAIQRKKDWMVAEGADYHTVVFDDQKVFNANGEGLHGDEADRVIYYRRGYGSFRVGSMYQCADMDELRTMIQTPLSQLPKAAMPLEGYVGYRN